MIRNEYMGRPFTTRAKEWALKMMGYKHNKHRRTICNVLKDLHAKTGENELCAEALWMAKRMNKKLTRYKWLDKQRKKNTDDPI